MTLPILEWYGSGGLLVAGLLGLVRLLIILPWVAPISLGAIGWLWILDSIYSVVNTRLKSQHVLPKIRQRLQRESPGTGAAGASRAPKPASRARSA